MSPSYHSPDSLWLEDEEDSVVAAEDGDASLLLEAAATLDPELTRLNEWRRNRLVFFGLVPVALEFAPARHGDLDSAESSPEKKCVGDHIHEYVIIELYNLE